jgi:hypothetical protein
VKQIDEQEARIAKVISDDENLSFKDSVEKFYHHLNKSLQLPFEVTGIEDFQWEEYYMIGSGDQEKYRKLCKNQPSFRDTFDLVAIKANVHSKWMMFSGEDLAGQVQRKSDGKEFYLGVAEIEAVDKKSKNYQLLDDYVVWFVNSQ